MSQEAGLLDNLKGIAQHTEEQWELVVTFDGCTDNSEGVAQRWAAEFLRVPPPGLLRLLLIKIRQPVWETSADNVGMRAAQGRFYVLVQPDMLISEPGWKTHLAVAVRPHPDVFAVSGRCAHILYHHRPSGPGQEFQQFVGRCNADIGSLELKPELQCVVALRDTVNRGPLLLRADTLQFLGYLDELNYFLGDDDHDLFVRAAQYGWRSSFVQIGVHAPLGRGSTRHNHNRTPRDLKYMHLRRARMQGGALRILDRNAQQPWHEDRALPAHLGCGTREMWWRDAFNRSAAGGAAQAGVRW